MRWAQSGTDRGYCATRWARENLGFWPRIDIKFYDARYWPSIGSILATGDLTQCIKAENRDVAILEEPEHLNWYSASPYTPRTLLRNTVLSALVLSFSRRAHAGADWTQCFRYVVGAIRHVCRRCPVLRGRVRGPDRDRAHRLPHVPPQ